MLGLYASHGGIAYSINQGGSCGRDGGGGGGFGGGFDGGVRHLPLVLPATSNRNIPEGPTFGPMPLACLAEMPRLRLVVVVVIAELGVC